MTTTHTIIPAALADYCEAVRLSRLGYVRGDANVFEAVVKDACAIPPGTPKTLREIIRSAVAKTVKECGGNVSAAAKKLKVHRSTIYAARKAVSV